MIPYTWTTPEADPANVEDWYGMEHWNGGATPTGDAYEGVVARWNSDPPGGSPPISVCHSPPRADLSTATTTSTPLATAGDLLRYRVTVSQRRPEAATSTTATVTLPPAATLVAANSRAGPLPSAPSW